jgi:hypothetical protein
MKLEFYSPYTITINLADFKIKMGVNMPEKVCCVLMS